MVTEKDLIYINLEPAIFDICVERSQSILKSIQDRNDLHDRDDLERFINVLMGEVAEQIVFKWLRDNNKYVEIPESKNTPGPDAGHDLLLKRKKDGGSVECSIKSSLSYSKGPSGIIENFRLATKKSELRDVNLQVYFWLTLNPPEKEPRVTIPSIRQSAIFGWYGKNDMEKFEKYKHENREVPCSTLRHARTAISLLHHIK